MKNKHALATLVVTLLLGSAYGSQATADAATCSGVSVTGNLAQAVAQRPAGTTFCLKGRYVVGSTVKPGANDKFIGVPDGSGNLPSIVAGSPAPEVGFSGGANVVYSRINVSGFKFRGIQPGAGSLISQTTVHHNRFQGIGGGGGSVTIDRSTVYANGNTLKYGFNSTGIKMVTDGNRITNNVVRGNVGNGVWADRNASGWVIAGNTITGNTLSGIRLEIAHNVSITNNLIDSNVHTRINSHGGVDITSSKDVTVVSNRITRNVRNVFIRGDKRAGNCLYNSCGYLPTGISVRYNSVAGGTAPMGLFGKARISGSQFIGNSYTVPSSSVRLWHLPSGSVTWSGWRAVGYDRTGVLRLN